MFMMTQIKPIPAIKPVTNLLRLFDSYAVNNWMVPSSAIGITKIMLKYKFICILSSRKIKAHIYPSKIPVHLAQIGN